MNIDNPIKHPLRGSLMIDWLSSESWRKKRKKEKKEKKKKKKKRKMNIDNDWLIVSDNDSDTVSDEIVMTAVSESQWYGPITAVINTEW